MSTASAFQSAMDAVQQGRFDEAVSVLESLCQEVRPPSKAYYETNLWLVRAYRDSGQLPKAIKLCRQLSTSSHPQVQQWAQKMLTTLRNPASLSSAFTGAQNTHPVITTPGPEAPTLLTAPTQFPASAVPPNTEVRRLMAEAEANTCLDQGLLALKAQQWPEAIATLKQFLNGVAPTDKNYSYAQTALAKAYQGNQQSKAAIAIAHALLQSPHPASKLWAEQFLLEHEEIASRPSLSQRISTVLSLLQPAHSIQTLTPQSDLSLEIPTNILSAICYISFYGGTLLWLMFGEMSFFHFVLGHWLLPCVNSLAVMKTTRVAIARKNAQSALNFWLMTLGIVVLIGVIGWLIKLTGLDSGLAGVPLLGSLGSLVRRMIKIGFYGLPLFGTLQCLMHSNKAFRFPFVASIVRS